VTKTYCGLFSVKQINDYGKPFLLTNKKAVNMISATSASISNKVISLMKKNNNKKL
jgi:hypothetical protein